MKKKQSSLRNKLEELTVTDSDCGALDLEILDLKGSPVSSLPAGITQLTDFTSLRRKRRASG